jgi:hypothetical protein
MMRAKISLILAMVLIVILLFTSCSAGKEELVPGRYAGFKMGDYMDLTSSTAIGGSIMELSLNGETLLLEKRFAKGTEEFVIYVAKFSKASRTTSFWYGLIREVSNDFRSVVSALPLIYGEFQDEIRQGYMKAWFSGKWLYVFLGKTKSEVNSAVKTFKEFEKLLVKSVDS